MQEIRTQGHENMFQQSKFFLQESKKALEQTTSNYESQKQLIQNLQQEKKKMTQLIKVLIIENNHIVGWFEIDRSTYGLNLM